MKFDRTAMEKNVKDLEYHKILSLITASIGIYVTITLGVINGFN